MWVKQELKRRENLSVWDTEEEVLESIAEDQGVVEIEGPYNEQDCLAVLDLVQRNNVVAYCWEI